MQTATMLLTRRQWGGAFVATLAVLAGGCATISPGEERTLGQEGADEVEQTVGLVQDAKVVGCVRQVGGRLTPAAQRADVVWQFNITDDGRRMPSPFPAGGST